MGRYYSGDIEGKFWFGVQPSDAASRFGGSAGEPNYICYNFDEEDFDLEELQSLLDKVNIETSSELTLESDPEELYQLKGNKSDIADLELGLKIYQCIIEHASCSFEAEL